MAFGSQLGAKNFLLLSDKIFRNRVYCTANNCIKGIDRYLQFAAVPISSKRGALYIKEEILIFKASEAFALIQISFLD